MAQGGSKQPNTAYGMFLQACWAQHKRQYPETLINKEIEEFNKQCSVWDVLIISPLKFEIERLKMYYWIVHLLNLFATELHTVLVLKYPCFRVILEMSPNEAHLCLICSTLLWLMS